MKEVCKFMEIVPLRNLRDNEGEFKDPSVLCSVCGETREMFTELRMKYNGPLVIRMCKGCLSDSIHIMNRSFIEEIKNIKRDETT